MLTYSELEKEFHEPLYVVGVSFKDEYTKALQSFDGFEMDTDEKYKAIRDVLQAILERYTKSKPKSDAGGFFRKAGKVLLYLLPFLKYVKFKK